MGKVISAHAVVFLEMADDGLDGGSSFEFALDLRRDAALLAARVDLELVIGAEVCATVGNREVWPYGMGRIGADLAPIVDLLRGFHSVQLCPGENGSPLITQSPAVAEPELITYVERHHNDPPTYMDIVARKAVCYGTPTAVM
jgi:hypothetical protein